MRLNKKAIAMAKLVGWLAALALGAVLLTWLGMKIVPYITTYNPFK
jgi:hypothetical protein